MFEQLCIYSQTTHFFMCFVFVKCKYIYFRHNIFYLILCLKDIPDPQPTVPTHPPEKKKYVHIFAI